MTDALNDQMHDDTNRHHREHLYYELRQHGFKMLRRESDPETAKPVLESWVKRENGCTHLIVMDKFNSEARSQIRSLVHKYAPNARGGNCAQSPKAINLIEDGSDTFSYVIE